MPVKVPKEHSPTPAVLKEAADKNDKEVEIPKTKEAQKVAESPKNVDPKVTRTDQKQSHEKVVQASQEGQRKSEDFKGKSRFV